jgi:hypothetical protein
MTNDTLPASMKEEALPELPLAFEWIYEFPSPFGGVHRKLTSARWNGSKPSESYLVYTAAQMREYALAARAGMAPAKPVAWMTEDGRVATDGTKQNMPSAARESFSIPLGRLPALQDGEAL